MKFSFVWQTKSVVIHLTRFWTEAEPPTSACMVYWYASSHRSYRDPVGWLSPQLGSHQFPPQRSFHCMTKHSSVVFTFSFWQPRQVVSFVRGKDVHSHILVPCSQARGHCSLAELFFCCLKHSVAYCATLELDSDMRPTSIAHRPMVARPTISVINWLIHCRANFGEDFSNASPFPITHCIS